MIAAEPSAHIEGLVLCRVGDNHIAFPAAAVGSIDQWEPGGVPAPHARAAFGLPAAPGKLLVRGGFSLVVDGLEIVADRSTLLPVPSMLLGAVGGALRGFVSPSAGALVPLLGLAEFSSFVTRGGA
ncbi:MAG: protein CrdC [Myxococcaceae bacterium]|nr:protein CrdC [Myxococcaceae bacterium]